jgi:hypothetical protein
MLGSLTAADARIDGITDADSGNPDTQGNAVKPQALADFQGQLDPDAGHQFAAVDLQIFSGTTGAGRKATVQDLRRISASNFVLKPCAGKSQLSAIPIRIAR